MITLHLKNITLQIKTDVEDTNYLVWNKLVDLRLLMSNLPDDLQGINDKIILARKQLHNKKYADLETSLQNFHKSFWQIKHFQNNPYDNPVVLSIACMVQDSLEAKEHLNLKEPLQDRLKNENLIKTAKWLVNEGLTRKDATNLITFFFKRLSGSFSRKLGKHSKESNNFQKRLLNIRKNRLLLICDRIISFNQKDIDKELDNLEGMELDCFKPDAMFLTPTQVEQGQVTEDTKRRYFAKSNLLSISKYFNVPKSEIENYTVWEYFLAVDIIEKEYEAQKEAMNKK